MQITLIASDPRAALFLSLFPHPASIHSFTFSADLQVPTEFISGASPKLGHSEWVRNGSEEALVRPGLVLAG
jgi:hypothetical protein